VTEATEEAVEYDPNEIKDPTIEVEDLKPFDPSLTVPPEFETEEFMQNAIRNSERRQYDHTFFEIFEDQIMGYLEPTEQPLTIGVAHSIMTSWPWFRYSDIEMYLVYRKRMLKEVLAELEASYPKPREELFKENVDDWQHHREAYLELMARWAALNNKWSDEWAKLKLTDRKKAILHAVVADLAYLTVSDDGMIGKFQYLVDFDNPKYIITAEEAIAMDERIKELSDV